MSLGCMETTPLAILLSESGKLHPNLIKAEMSEQDVLRLFQWKENPTREIISRLSPDLPTFPRTISPGSSRLVDSYRYKV